MAAIIPPPRRHVTVYSGVLSSHELLRRTFGSEIVCPDCGGAIRLIALVKTERTIQAMLRGMGIQQVFHSPGPPEALVSQTTHYEKEDLEWNEEAKDWAD